MQASQRHQARDSTLQSSMVPHHLLTTTLLMCFGSATALSSSMKIPSKRTSFKEFFSPSTKFGLLRELFCTRDEMSASEMQGDDVEKNQKNLQTHLQLEDTTDFHLLMHAAIQTLIHSDLDGEELDHSYGSASQGLWMHAPSAKKMQQLLNRVTLKVRFEDLICGHVCTERLVLLLFWLHTRH